MRKNSIGLVMVALAVLWMQPAPAQKSDRAEVLLEAARKKELLEGNLDAAIKQYKEIIFRYSTNRAVVAKALVQMGQCYDKLGDAEARKAYERVVRDFGDQKDAVAEARKHLRTKGGSAENGIVARLVEENNDGRYGPAISRDGHYIASARCCEPDTERQVRVHDLTSGEVRRLVAGDPREEKFDSALISPDGKQVAYGRAPLPKGLHEVYVVGIDGSAPRLLLSGGWTQAWSPDGKYLLAVTYRNKEPQRLLLPVSGGDPVVIGTGDMRTARFSPDGSHFAFAKPPVP